jgi:hypothetical protein
MKITGNNNISVTYGGVPKTLDELRTKDTYSAPITSNPLTTYGGLGWQFCDTTVPCDDAHPWKMPIGIGFPGLYQQ